MGKVRIQQGMCKTYARSSGLMVMVTDHQAEISGSIPERSCIFFNGGQFLKESNMHGLIEQKDCTIISQLLQVEHAVCIYPTLLTVYSDSQTAVIRVCDLE